MMRALARHARGGAVGAACGAVISGAAAAAVGTARIQERRRPKRLSVVVSSRAKPKPLRPPLSASMLEALGLSVCWAGGRRVAAAAGFMASRDTRA